MRKLFTLLILSLFCVVTATAQFNLIFNQPYYDGGNAATSAIDDVSAIDYEAADNFSALTDPVEEVIFYGLTLKFDGTAWVEQTPATIEPFFIRFYTYETGVTPGLVAPTTGTYEIALEDDYGDGWNDGLVSVFVDGVAVLTDLTLLTGYGPETHTFSANSGQYISTVYSPGSYAYENYYTIFNPDGNIIATDGDPGVTAPTGIPMGGLPMVLEPDWANPVSTQTVTATVTNIGTVWTGTYQLYKFTATLNTPVDLDEGWVSAQIDANTGSGTWFLWLNSIDGDALSFQRTEALPGKTPMAKVNLARLSMDGGNGSSKGMEAYDFGLELWGGVLTAPPSCATNPVPADGSPNVSILSSLSWTAEPTADGYKIYFGTDNPPTNIENGTDLGLATTYIPDNPLEYSTEYIWKIVPYNTFGDATDCPIWSFTTSSPPPPGSTCENPYTIATLPFNYTGTTDGFGDDYEYGWITPNSYYITGDDMVFEFTLTEAGYLGGSMTTTDSYLGLFILEDCPDPVSPAAVLRSATSSGTSVTLTEILLQSGTYFAIVSSWPSPQSIEFILSLSFEPLPDCPIPTALTAIPASFSAELGWTENGTATLWDIEWGDAGFTPGEGTIITGVSNPYTLTGLEPSTPYDFYVRADCGEGSVSDWSVVRNFTTLAACPAPTVLTATNISTTSAVLGWTENGTATSWDIEYGQTPFTPTGTPTISGVTNPYSLTGLSSGITYAYYVRAYCSETYQSTWSGPLTFTTQTVVPAPYTEGFITTSTPTGWTTTGWLIGSARGATGNPGNNIYRNLWSSATTGTFTTVNVGPVSAGMSLTFDYQLTNYSSPYAPPVAGSGNFIVSVSTDFGLNYTELETTNNDGVAGWRSKSYDLSAYAGSNVKVRIVGNRTSGDYDLAFDNFYIGPPISCLAPTAVIVTTVTQTTATISWTAPDPAPANGYEYEVRTDGDPGSGATGLAAFGTTNGTTANITGLEDGTEYMVYVRSVCGDDEYSNWTGGVQFVTTCFTRNLPFTEDFEADSPNLSCWAIYNIDLAGTSWGLSSAYNHTDGGTYSAAHVYGPSTNTEDGYLVSPGLIIPASEYIELSFWSYNYFTSFYDKNSVMISAGSPDPTDGDYVEIWSPASVTASWEQTLLDLSAYHGQTIYIAFRYEGSDAHNWYVDDVSVSVQTPSTKTLNLTDVRLEHLFVTGTGGLMNQAYNASGPQFTAPTADVITVELRDAATYATVLRTYPGIALSQTGTASVTDIDLPDGNYRITIKHRNSIETTTMLPVDFTGATISYSFATQGSAYGNNLKLIDGFYCIYGGDVNQDGQVEGLDVSEIENGVNAFSTGYLPIDVDGDGSLGISDYSIWENNNNTFVKRVIPIP